MSVAQVRDAQPGEPLACRVYRLLSDRACYSGSDLARACGVSRSAVWKAVAALRSLGVAVDAVPNRGYRLPGATAPLQAECIGQRLAPEVAVRLRDGRTHWCVDSTNAQLLQRTAPPPGQFDFMTAEYQSAGRGRRARRWLAPPGGAICLSISWSFAALPPDLGALSLAVGVCVLRSLPARARGRVGLKWPNDLVVGNDKLGGILTELRAEASGPAVVVIGIGLNVELGTQLREQVQASGTHPIDLASVARLADGSAAADIESCRDRNALTAALLERCIEGLLQFEGAGLRPFIGEWRAADALAGKAVLVIGQGAPVAGHARGIDTDGALCVQTREGLQRFVSAEVSVRSAA